MVNGTISSSLILSNDRSINGTFIYYRHLNGVENKKSYRTYSFLRSFYLSRRPANRASTSSSASTEGSAIRRASGSAASSSRQKPRPFRGARVVHESCLVDVNEHFVPNQALKCGRLHTPRRLRTGEVATCILQRTRLRSRR